MRPEQLTGKNILYGCLDWGNGHTARSIPLIRQLISQGNAIVLWCSEQQQSVFQAAGLEVDYFIGFLQDFRFTGDGNFRKELFRNAFRFRRACRKERQSVSAFAAERAIDVIISDHRYGLRSDLTPSIFVTHQVKLPPKSGFAAQWIHRKWMRPFDHVWIMDEQQERLAGELSAPVDNSSYIGHYSRFSGMHRLPGVTRIVGIISGPEPYAEQLYALLVRLARSSGGEWTFVCPKDYGLPHAFPVIHDWKEADAAILKAGLIVSRNGYSTLMDLMALEKKAILLPTPGQLEQMYLAELHSEHPGWRIATGEEELRELIRDFL